MVKDHEPTPPLRPLDEPSLEGLLRAVAAGDGAAFARFYDRTAPKLFAIALRACGDRAVAEDALQEAYAEIWSKAARFDEEKGRASAWASVIARNRAVDQARRRSSGVHAAALADKTEVVEIADPNIDAETRADIMALRKCLEELGEKEQQAVLRAYYRGETRADLAAYFGVPANTVKTWLRRSLAALRDCLGQ